MCLETSVLPQSQSRWYSTARILQLQRLFPEGSYGPRCKALVLRGFVQGAVALNYRRYDRVTKLERRFRAALWFIKKIDDGAASSDLPCAKGDLSATHFDTSVLCMGNEHDLLL